MGELLSLKDILESLLFFTNEPLKMPEMVEITGGSKKEVENTLQDLIKEYKGKKSLQILQLAGGWQMATRPEVAIYIEKMQEGRKLYRLSQAAMESLAIIAYKQPVTRVEIEAIRGVHSGNVLNNLLKIKLIRIVGRKKAPGRPMTFGTTRLFLKYFGLNDLKDLPPLESFKEMQKSF